MSGPRQRLALVRKPPQMSWGRFLLGLCVPHSVAMMAADVLRRPDRRLQESLALQREHAARGAAPPYSYEAAVSHLAARGLDEEQVRAGSMPEASLLAAGAALTQHLGAGRPLAILHVGNFVGVSLSWFADDARRRHPGSRVVAIDPNVTHRGIARPQEHVTSLLTRFGLQDAVMLITGYTLSKNPSDLDPEDPQGHFARDEGCEGALEILAGLAGQRFDVAVMDGNHEPDYLRRELNYVRQLLVPGGLLVLDDVFDWRSLTVIARELEKSPDATLEARDGRFGIWRIADPG